MRGVIVFFIDFFRDKQAAGVMNIPLLIVTLAIILIALWICFIISKRNKLYIRYKNDKKDNAYT